MTYTVSSGTLNPTQPNSTRNPRHFDAPHWNDVMTYYVDTAVFKLQPTDLAYVPRSKPRPAAGCVASPSTRKLVPFASRCFSDVLPAARRQRRRNKPQLRLEVLARAYASAKPSNHSFSSTFARWRLRLAQSMNDMQYAAPPAERRWKPVIRNTR